jgi:hypothetical protein
MELKEMYEFSNPLDYILKCTEQGLIPKIFTVQNAKDELKKLRSELQELKEYNQELQWINKLLHEHQNSSCNKKCSRQTLTSDDDSVQ